MIETAAANTPTAIQPHPSIIQAAIDYLDTQMSHGTSNGQASIHPGRLDPRLRLPLCGKPLQAAFAAGARAVSRTMVKVFCSQPQWSVNVPARIELQGTVVVSARPLTRGTALKASDLLQIKKDISSLDRGYYSTIEEIIGRIVQRPVSAAKIISPSLLDRRDRIQRGATVVIRAMAGGIEVKMQGIALMEGGLGDRIRVRNSHSQRVIAGTVTDIGIVDVVL